MPKVTAVEDRAGALEKRAGVIEGSKITLEQAKAEVQVLRQTVTSDFTFYLRTA